MGFLYILRMFKKAQEKTDAVSPVIGVILLVAVTVALVALATVIVFDIGSDVSDTADATIQLDQVEDGVQATIVRNENVASFDWGGDLDSEIDDEDEVISDDGEVGSSDTIDSENLDGETGAVSVIAELEDGSTEVLTSTDYDFE